MSASDPQRPVTAESADLRPTLEPALDPTLSLNDPHATRFPPTLPDGGRQAGDPPPRRFAEYDLLEELGRGGMGVVWKARHWKTGREVALKMILSGALASRQAVERFHNEARAAMALDHPGIIPIYEIGEADGQHFFTMQFLPGGTLQHRLQQGPLPPNEAAALVRQLAEGVQHAHERGVIHRDLKPANVLMATPSPREGSACVKITDFGLARMVEGSGLTATGEQLGTPGYMAPEQAAGQVREIGPASDTYSLGAVLYCLLTGRPPFQAATALETMRLVLDQEPVSPRRLNPNVPRDLETVCLKCLEKSSARRYGTARELAEDLGRFERGEPVRARPLSVLGRSWRWGRRNPLLAALAGVGSTGLILLAIFWMTRPAYLDLSVIPIDAEVTLGGEPISLKDGRGAFTLPPGRHELVAQADGYETLTQSLVLSRGRDNAEMVTLQLRSSFGRLELDTAPSLALVEVLDAAGKTVHRGSTPYISPRLRAGNYRIKLLKEEHLSATVEAVVPSGEQTVEIPTVSLAPRKDR